MYSMYRSVHVYILHVQISIHIHIRMYVCTYYVHTVCTDLCTYYVYTECTDLCMNQDTYR